ncbi:MAG TPA: cytochrome P450 [Streptosporangiaceae bacterium]
MHEDPYPTYARMRDEVPVYRNEEQDFWAFSRHSDVLGAFRDSELFSSGNGPFLDPMSWGPKAARHMSFVAMDPPEHTRTRGLVARAFTQRRVNELAPRIRRIAARHADAALQAGTFDLVADFAARVPADVISELAGVPEGDRAELSGLINRVTTRSDAVHDITPDGAQAGIRLLTYLHEHVVARRSSRTRPDDLTSALIEAADADDRLGDEEITAVLSLLIGAGNETTTHLIGNAWHAAGRDPAVRAEVLGGRVGDWVEETLRYDSPAQSMARTLTGGTDLHGVRLPAGARILLLVGAANRDGDVFPDPDRFDLDRDRSGFVPFGNGRHFCLGAPLARMEARIALTELASRVTDYAIDPARTTRTRSPTVRGFRALWTTVKR